jgi:hypothetical protein
MNRGGCERLKDTNPGDTHALSKYLLKINQPYGREKVK